jgi:diguanylate cyclase (GGDEF)-like protein
VTNAKLFAQTQRLAIADGLTGLMLRRPFMEQLTRELTRSARSREPVSVLLLDVDEFKKYNDSFGHTAGDVVLKGVADVLRAAVPAGGAVARYGGEEFSVLLPRLSRHEAGDLAEKLRRLVEEQVRGGRPSPRGPGDGRQVTVSIGVAAFPDDAQVELELLRVADQRLYQAKRSGRNLVCAS